jgi:mannosyltransferase OCH1-like enzyme
VINVNEQIPKLIHYCWFGNCKKSKDIKKYMNTWKILNDYKIIEWNENNSDLKNNKFVKDAYNNKKWAFVSDYIRLKVLYEYGGIYLDTDVEVKNKFDNLLDNNMFLGFIYNCSVGTAVIGSIPKHPIIKELLDLYESVALENGYSEYKNKKFSNIKLANNNDLFTLYLLTKYPNFKLNNKKQQFLNITIYPKEYFEIEPILGEHYSIHRCNGSWIKEQTNNKKYILKQCIKTILSKIPIINLNAIITHINLVKRTSRLPFYKKYLKDKL